MCLSRENKSVIEYQAEDNGLLRKVSIIELLYMKMCVKIDLKTKQWFKYRNNETFYHRNENLLFLRDPTTLLGDTGKLAGTHLRMLEFISCAIDMIVGWLENKSV